MLAHRVSPQKRLAQSSEEEAITESNKVATPRRGKVTSRGAAAIQRLVV
jgi:hypothetical protein